MALHQVIQRCLLVGIRIDPPPPTATPVPPARLVPLIEALKPVHDRYDARAIEFGHRYRSAFWMIYLLSAIAVLFAVMPLALGWDDSRHAMHPLLFLWALGEVVIILTVGLIYWTGHRRDWQGQWLSARTLAELTQYLPLVAPLVDFAAPVTQRNWYARVFEPGGEVHAAPEIEALCVEHEALARDALAGAWDDPGFSDGYARWTIAVLGEQRNYHGRVGKRQRALLHRVHGLSTRLFGLTAIGALFHLAVHSLWLSVVTTFFPALGAGLHGALAQSEAYRLAVTSERLVHELTLSMERLERAVGTAGHAMTEAARDAARDALAVILEEHQDWHMLVRPHHLPLG